MEDAGCRIVHCAKLCDAMGWTHGIDSRFCEKCIEEGWYEEPDPKNVPAMRSEIRAVLSGQLKSLGEHSYGQFDLEDCFRRFQGVSTEQEQRDLLRDCVVAWAARSESQGGLALSVVEQEAQKLAAAFGMQDVLAEIEEKHQ